MNHFKIFTIYIIYVVISLVAYGILNHNYGNIFSLVALGINFSIGGLIFSIFMTKKVIRLHRTYPPLPFFKKYLAYKLLAMGLGILLAGSSIITIYFIKLLETNN